MGAAEAVQKARKASVKYARQLGSTLTVGRNTGALDPVTFEPVPSTVYSGIGRIQTYEAQERTSDVGGGSVTVQRYVAHVPIDGTYTPAEGDVVTVTACPSNTAAVGRKYLVRGPHFEAAASGYRLQVDDTNGHGGA
jgi:hypothetical protein